MKPDKTIFFGIAALAIILSLVLLAFFAGFQKSFANANTISNSSPVGLIAIVAIVLFGGIYLFKAAGHILKGVIE